MNATPKEIRQAIATAYWMGHTDGRLCGPNHTPNFKLGKKTINDAFKSIKQTRKNKKAQAA
jgi:hypothetical protein